MLNLYISYVLSIGPYVCCMLHPCQCCAACVQISSSAVLHMFRWISVLDIVFSACFHIISSCHVFVFYRVFRAGVPIFSSLMNFVRTSEQSAISVYMAYSDTQWHADEKERAAS